MSPLKKLLFAVFVMGLVLLAGTLGYTQIGGWPWFDSLYFTVITVFGIGYGEHAGMNTEERVFTLVLIFLGFAAIAYAVSTLVQTVVESELVSRFGRRKMEKDITKLRNHYIVCGAGRMGSRVIEEMARRGVEFVVVESDAVKVERLRSQGALVLEGDATHEEVLRQAGVARASGIVCAVASDADNLYIVLNARDLNKNVLIVARANDEGAMGRLRKAGANKVVSPIVTGSHQMAQMVLRPVVADFVDLATMTPRLDLAIEQVEIRAASPFIGRSLKDTGIGSSIEVIVIAIKRASGKMLFNPPPTTLVETGDALVAVGSPDCLGRLERMANPELATLHTLAT